MIRAEASDREALGARSPSELAMYLRAREWTLRELDGAGAVWVKTVDGEEFEALQPRESAMRDYPSRVRDLVHLLGIVEKRSELALLADITNVAMDVYSVRTLAAGGTPGMVGLDDGVRVYESARNLVIAAACAVGSGESRAVQPMRKPAGVAEFLREVRIGAPVEGSFVLSVHTPVPPRLSAAPGDEDAEPFERRVSLCLYDAVRAAQGAADDALIAANGLDGFTAAVSVGVSANLCEALVGLGGETGRPFEIAVRPAAARPIGRRVLEPVRFRRDHLPVLASAAAELREHATEESVEVVGNVVRLHREGPGPGEIGIAGTVDGDERMRRVWMELGDQEYAAAMRAHQEMLGVSVRGDLVRRGNRRYLINPTGFRMGVTAD